jgi:hypothetical protein
MPVSLLENDAPFSHKTAQTGLSLISGIISIRQWMGD